MNEPMEDPIVVEALKGNVSALEFVRAIALVLHGWDDMVDRDHRLTDADINRIFTTALIVLPRNAFYREHFEEFNPLLMQAITNWRIATDIERNSINDHHLGIAFILRSSYVDLAVMAASIIGGIEWGVKYGHKIREWAHDEKFGGFLTNLAAERAARKGIDVLR